MSGFEGDDDDWVPPSEAEMKILAAKRERSDKISKLMGDYLLKGYKMLATSCVTCGSIELEDKHGQLYCVACSEVDMRENSKDNPALNTQAAESLLREESRSLCRNASLQSAATATGAAELLAHLQTTSVPLRSNRNLARDSTYGTNIPLADTQQPHQSGIVITSGGTHSSASEREIQNAINSTTVRMRHARERMDTLSPESLDECERYLKFIQYCASTIKSLKDALS